MRNMKALMLMSLALAACQTQKGPVADLVLMNGHIITMDEGAPEAQAIAVAGDRILAVGTDAAIESHIGDSTEVVDLEGKTVIPGMIDSHVHFIGLGNRLLQLDARNVRDQDEIIERVAEQAKNVEPGEWIQGRGWDQNRWTVKEFPPEEELDAVSPENPVYLRRVDGHAAWVNSRALEIANITRDTPDPAGGRIIRYASGEPAGTLIDNAFRLVSQHIPPISKEQKRRAIGLAIEECLSSDEKLRTSLRERSEPGANAPTTSRANERRASEH